MAQLDLGYALNLPPERAVEYMVSKGMRLSWNWHDTWKEAHAKAFTVARVVNMEVLKAIRAEVEEAIKGGTTQAEFMRKLAPRLKEMGWWGRSEQDDGKSVGLGNPWRLKVIYQTNLQTAYMAGRWKELQDNADARPYWRYVAVMDSRTRPAHRVLHGKVFRHDDPFWTKFFPPNGWGCRCRVRALAPDQLAGAPVESSAGRIDHEERRIGTNPETGETIRRPVHGYRLPSGQRFTPDPGWDYNPGQAAWQPDLNRYPSEVARQYLEGSISGPDFTRFFKGEVKGDFPVTVLDDRARKVLGTDGQVVKLSSDTLDKQSRSHPDLTPEEYRTLPRITEGEVVQQDDQRLVFFKSEGRLYKAVIKATRDRRELYVTSFQRADEGEKRRETKRGQAIEE
ncbi:MAG: minor capsid protein [Magnetococcales bacterium]|nr:minor capsid protein [Magnetococcales bacterium]